MSSHLGQSKSTSSSQCSLISESRSIFRNAKGTALELPSNCHHHVGSKQRKEIRVHFLSPIQERWREILKILKKKQKSKSSPRYLLTEGPWTWLFILLSFLICIYSNITWEAEATEILQSIIMVSGASKLSARTLHLPFSGSFELQHSTQGSFRNQMPPVYPKGSYLWKFNLKKTLSSRVYLASRVK